MIKRFALVFAVAILAVFIGVTHASAQNGAFAPYVTAGVSVQSGGTDWTNKTNPNFALGGGIESDTKYFLFDTNAAYNTADNVITRNGYTVTAQASGYVKVFDHILAGVGVNESFNNITPSLAQIKLGAVSTQGYHPYVGVGYETSKLRVIGNYLLPAKDSIPNERILNGTGEVFLTKHIRATSSVQLDSADFSGTRQLKVGVGAGLKFVL
jgi:hypothetical protein